jgi:two-component system sensor kinase FixL
MSVLESQPDFKFPKTFLYIVLAICALPYGLNLAGFDFSSEVHGFHVKEIAAWGISKSALVDEMFYTLTGALEHGLMEWSAVSVAALTILLAFSHFAINKDVTTPIIGIALFCSGTMDAFHTLAAMRLIDAVADNSNLIPFTWALSRGFNAAILIVGALICLRLGISDTRSGLSKITTISLFFGGVAYYLITYSATNENLPNTQFPDALITRPYDAVPLVMFALAWPLFWKLYKKRPSLLTASLVIALIPEVVVESHMAFGSSTLFDNHFNIAHFLKIIAYLIPFIGLVLDYIGTYKKMNVVIEDLKTSNSAKEQLSANLLENQLRTSAVLNTVVDGIITIDEKGIIDTFNPAAVQLFGYEPSEVTGKNVKMLMPEPYSSEHDQYLKNYRDTGVSKVIGIGREVVGLRKNGSTFPLELGISEMYVGKKRMFTGIVRDITESKKLEEEKISLIRDLQESNDNLDNSQRRTTAILDNAVDAIISINEKGIIDQFNISAEKMFGYDKAEVAGKNIKMLMPEPYQSEHDGYMAKYSATGKAHIIGINREVEGLRQDGTTFPMNLAVGEVIIGERRLYTGIVRDITEQKKIEEEKFFLIKDLKESNEEMEEFTYRTSHDLKAPLVNIRGLSDIMREDLEDGDYKEVSENIKKVGALSIKLESLIGEIVEVVKVDREQEKFEEVDIANQLELIKESLNILIDEKQVEVQLSLGGNKTVWTQKSLIQRVLENLISNAIKYSDPEKTQRFVKVGVSDLNGDTQIQVSDNGLGIPDQYFGEVFGMFKRFHKESSFGSGLGLYLVKKSVDKINGKISLQSSPEGTVFTIVLPVSKIVPV